MRTAMTLVKRQRVFSKFVIVRHLRKYKPACNGEMNAEEDQYFGGLTPAPGKNFAANVAAIVYDRYGN